MDEGSTRKKKHLWDVFSLFFSFSGSPYLLPWEGDHLPKLTGRGLTVITLGLLGCILSSLMDLLCPVNWSVPFLDPPGRAAQGCNAGAGWTTASAVGHAGPGLQASSKLLRQLVQPSLLQHKIKLGFLPLQSLCGKLRLILGLLVICHSYFCAHDPHDPITPETGYLVSVLLPLGRGCHCCSWW